MCPRRITFCTIEGEIVDISREFPQHAFPFSFLPAVPFIWNFLSVRFVHGTKCKLQLKNCSWSFPPGLSILRNWIISHFLRQFLKCHYENFPIFLPNFIFVMCLGWRVTCEPLDGKFESFVGFSLGIKGAFLYHASLTWERDNKWPEYPFHRY